MTWPANVRGWVAFCFATVFAVALPIFILLGSAEYVIKSDWLYSYDWWRNSIPEHTGLPASELNSAADQIKDYFTNDKQYLDVKVHYEGRELSIYNQREILHMADVKTLMQGVFQIVRVSGLVLLALALAGLSFLGRRFWSLLFNTMRWSALGAGVVVGVLALAVVIDFDWVFTQFHLLSFANDLWQLDPRNSFLLAMFPERFFFEATLFIAVLAVASFALFMWAAYLMKKRYGVKA